MSQDDFAFEPIRGLPERPPEGEVILLSLIHISEPTRHLYIS